MDEETLYSIIITALGALTWYIANRRRPGRPLRPEEAILAGVADLVNSRITTSLEEE